MLHKEGGDEHLLIFMEEMFLYLYNELNWENYAEIIRKIVVLRNEKKMEERKLTKFKEK